MSCSKNPAEPWNHTDYTVDGATPGIYVALDTLGNPFYLVACSINGEESKIFLVKDIDAGLTSLLKPEFQYSITGGVVEECDVLALQATIPGY